MDVQIKQFLTDLFSNAPGRFMSSAKDCAEICYAMLIGLRTAVFFDSDLGLANARRLFKDTMSRMAGL